MKETLLNEGNLDVAIPQGSILDPLIILIFINNLQTYINTDCIVLYVYDVSVVSYANSFDKLSNKSLLQIQWIVSTESPPILNSRKTILMKFNITNNIEHILTVTTV